jgi:hypothetical protein
MPPLRASRWRRKFFTCKGNFANVKMGLFGIFVILALFYFFGGHATGTHVTWGGSCSA